MYEFFISHFSTFLWFGTTTTTTTKRKKNERKKICKIIKQTAEQQIQIHLRFESIKVEVTLASHAPARQPTNRPILLNQPFFFLVGCACERKNRCRMRLKMPHQTNSSITSFPIANKFNNSHSNEIRTKCGI